MSFDQHKNNQFASYSFKSSVIHKTTTANQAARIWPTGRVLYSLKLTATGELSTNWRISTIHAYFYNAQHMINISPVGLKCRNVYNARAFN